VTCNRSVVFFGYSEFIYLFFILLSLYCLSCDLRLLINHLVSSNFPKNTCIIVTNRSVLSRSLFFFTELCPTTLQKSSFFTQPLPECLSKYKCTISSPPLIQVQSISERMRSSYWFSRILRSYIY
jgi:hypothetical protein